MASPSRSGVAVGVGALQVHRVRTRRCAGPRGSSRSHRQHTPVLSRRGRMHPAEHLPRTVPERCGQTGSAAPPARRTSSCRATTRPAPAPLHSSRGTKLPAHSMSFQSSTPACLLSSQRVETDIPQPSQPAPSGWSCKGRGGNMRHHLVTDAPALRKLCSRARAGDGRLAPPYAGHPAQTRPLCALDCMLCDLLCETDHWRSLGYTSPLPVG